MRGGLREKRQAGPFPQQQLVGPRPHHGEHIVAPRGRSASIFVEAACEADDGGCQPLQLVDVRSRQAVKEPLPLRRERQAHHPPIVVVDGPLHEARLLGAVGELDRAVVTQEE